MKNLPNILIVDDSPENLLYLEVIIRNLHVNLVQALSGSAALEKVKGLELALAIIDVRMPGMNGYDLALKMNEDRAGNRVPVIFLTSNYFSEMEVLKGYDSWAVDFIFKPVSNQILLSKINVFLDLFNQKRKIISEVSLLKKSAGELTGVIAAQYRNEEKYRNFFDHAPDIIFVTDESGKFTEVNGAACKITGYSKNELMQMMAGDLFLKGLFEKQLLNFRGKAKNNWIKAEMPFKHKDGTIRCLAVEVVMLDERQLLGFAKDITGCRQTEETLLQEQLFSKALLDSIPGIFYLYTFPELRLVTWNKRHETLFGYEESEMEGRHFLDWHMPEATGAVFHALELFRESGKSSIETSLVTKEGRLIPFLLTAVKYECHGKNYLIGTGTEI